jgi:hypothetical protein
MDVILDSPQCPAIHHLACCRSNTAGGDVHNGVGGVIDAIKNGQQRFDALCSSRQLNGNFGYESKRSFTAHE